MYMQHERHSDNDPNSRHQQTEQSYLKSHWKPTKSQSEPSDFEDPCAKPSQTEASFLREHHTPKNPVSEPESKLEQDEEEPSCSCKVKRSQSADPPAVKTHVCQCHEDALPCGVSNLEKPSQKGPCSVRTSVTEQSASFKSALTNCTKELLDPCTCGSNPPYWAGQSNVVSAPSYSRDPIQSKVTVTSFKSGHTIAPDAKPARSRHSRSKSLSSMPSKSNPPNQSGVTWLSALKDPDSEAYPVEKPPCICNATQTSKPPSMVSYPRSQGNYQSMSSATRSGHPCNQPSFGADTETSATTRSQSIVGQITCLCASEQKPVKGFVTNLADTPSHRRNQEDREFVDCTECAAESLFQPGPSARIQHPSGFAQFEEYQTSQCDPSASFRSRKVSLKDHEKFCDCGKSSESESDSDPIQTSLHTHRSLSGGSCLCNGDEPPPEDLSQSPCVHKECQCYVNDDLPEMFSAQEGTGFQTPEDICGNKTMACCTRKQRILELMEKLTTPSCDCGVSRPCMIQQLFRELTLLLRSEKESAVAPEEEPSEPCLPFDECCAAQHDRKGEEEPGDKPKSKRELRRVECFHQLEEYLRKCFLPPPEPEVPETDIYAFELDPDFPPEPEPEKCIIQPCNFSSEQFFDIGDPRTCSGDGLDGDVFLDCEGDDDEKKKCDCKEESELCKQLKAFFDKELQEADINTEGKEPEQKTQSMSLKEICDGSTNTVPCGKEDKSEQIVCPFAGMVSCPPWTKEEKDWAAYPYSIDPCAEPEPPIPPPKVPCTGLLPDGPLPPELKSLCEQLLQQALKDCGLCPGGDDTAVHSCEDIAEPCDVCPAECEEGEEECPEECPEECQEECEEQPEQGCLCCHCRALICDDECKTVSKTLRSAMCDPLCEMKYFIDSMIIDLHAMDCVLGNKKAKPKDIKANDATNRAGPGDSFPVTIKSVSPLGCTALYVRWELADCRAIAGYEIYVDGHLTNRFYSFRHEAGVITNVEVTNPHQIVLRAQAVGQEFPGEGMGKPQDCGCRTVAVAHPEMAAGAERPWSPSVYYYDPNQFRGTPTEGVPEC
uniref:Uncharacterized protein LOC108048846 n=1 Tax=Drosophila rhopaloa TaxID=1041015 RepID=A0A6P4F4B1_DRORH